MAPELNTLPSLKIDELDARPADDWIVEYDKHSDTLYMRVGEPRPATSIDLNGEIWARVDPETGDILGFEIEAFRDVFLARHPELPRPTEHAVQAKIEKESWLQVFMAYVRKMCALDGPNSGRGRFSPAT